MHHTHVSTIFPAFNAAGLRGEGRPGFGERRPPGEVGGKTVVVAGLGCEDQCASHPLLRACDAEALSDPTMSEAKSRRALALTVTTQVAQVRKSGTPGCTILTLPLVSKSVF